MGGKAASVEAMFTPDHGAVEKSQLSAFVRFCEAETGSSFPDQAAFHDFSVGELRSFWRLFLDWSALPVEGRPEPVCTDDRCEYASFFPELRLSYAESLLAGADDSPALTAYPPSGPPVRLTRAELRAHVRGVAAHLRELGLEPGDAVAAVGGNGAEMVIAGLACAAAGVTFSSASPDMGTPGLLSRFEQLAPSLLIVSGALGDRAGDLARELPTLRHVMALDDGRLLDLRDHGDRPWQRFPFNHPLFVLFTSGTTGLPKGIVHGAGGTLLEHVKEHRLHVDLRPGDKLFFHTTAAWMMWNWQLSALASGAEIVLYDGPIAGPATLWQVVARERVTVFGTSPPYLQLCEDSGYSPRRELEFPALRAVLSTGSILHDWQYDWVADHVGRLPLQSISGGTDIVGCFVLGSPNLPVRRGWVQCRSLGMDVRSLDGELVCRNPFPSRPLGLLGDDGSRFHDAYFAQNAGVWTHGDLIELDYDGQARMHGRSDGVLNVNGLRIGPAEIYRALGDVAEVKEAMAVERAGRLVLLVVLQPGAELDGRLAVRIRRTIARHTSPAQVPERVVDVEELPVTHSGKRSERAARDALRGEPVANTGALANPECLERIREAVEAAVTQPAAPVDLEGSTEQRLRAIWEAVLGVSPLRPDDNFFELGGTSLAAVRLLEAIHRHMGVDLSPSVLLDAPTTKELAALIDSPRRRSQSLVLLRPGTDPRPLFMVHSLFGDAVSMRPLALALDTARPVYGLQARGVDPGEEPQRTVEEMAATYVEEVRSAQPEGPYALAGHSLGGLVAFEMARRLSALGETVEWLGMIDSDLHHSCLRPAERARWLVWKAGDLARATITDPRTRIPRYARKLVLRVAPRAPLEAPRRESTVPPLMRRLEDAGWAAFDSYCPAPYPGTATFFQVEARREDMGDPLPVWRRMVEGGLSVELVPGSHADIVAEPNVRQLAKRMSAQLESSASGHRSRHS